MPFAPADTWHDRYRVYVFNGDGERIPIVEGRSSLSVGAKLIAYPLAVRLWMREVVHERVWSTAHGIVVEEIGWITMAGLGLAT